MGGFFILQQFRLSFQRQLEVKVKAELLLFFIFFK